MSRDSKKELRKLTEMIVSTLKDFPFVQVVTLFGSALSGRAKPHSDIDVGVAGRTLLSMKQKLILIESLSEATGKEVDLIDLHKVTGVILKEALSGGKVLLKKDPLVLAQLVKKLVFDQADFQPYVRRILRERRAKFLEET